MKGNKNKKTQNRNRERESLLKLVGDVFDHDGGSA